MKGVPPPPPKMTAFDLDQRKTIGGLLLPMSVGLAVFVFTEVQKFNPSLEQTFTLPYIHVTSMIGTTAVTCSITQCSGTVSCGYAKNVQK